MNKKKCQKIINAKPRIIDINTFDRFWSDFHEKNTRLKQNKTACKILFERCNCIGRRKKLIKGIEKTELSVYDYIKIKL